MEFRKNIRLKHYDYSTPGAYFLTICTDFKRDLIGENEKEILIQELKNLEERFSGVLIDYFSIMRTHIHCIIFLQDHSLSFFKVVQAFKSITTLKMKKLGFTGLRFWQKGYYEHVIRNEKAMLKIRQYIINNPRAEKLNLEEIYGEKKA